MEELTGIPLFVQRSLREAQAMLRDTNYTFEEVIIVVFTKNIEMLLALQKGELIKELGKQIRKLEQEKRKNEGN